MLPEEFYLNEDVVLLSKRLLGKKLVSNINGIITSGIITETEAYKGAEDKASHAYNNKRTKRTETMYAKGGVGYVYLCYGMHHLFNIVTAPADVPHAVLVRAIEPIDGIEHMCVRRNKGSIKPELTAGPARLTAALGITTDYDGCFLAANNGNVWVEDVGTNIIESNIVATTRVGIDYAKEHASLPWRFYIKDNIWVSKK